MSMYLKENIIKLRQKNKYSQEKLGELIGLTREGITHIENRNGNPSFETLLKLREVFKIDLESLVFKDLSKIE